MLQFLLRGVIDPMENIKLWSDVIGTWVAILGAFAGGIFAVIQYTDKLSSERVQESLKYVERFNENPLLQATIRLENFWNPKAEIVFQKQAAGEQVLSVYLDAEIRQNGLENEVSQLASFFENLRTCTCGKVCDGATTRQFFGKQAFDLHGVLFPYLKEQRRRLNDPSFGVGMELLAKNFKKKDAFMETYCMAGKGFGSNYSSVSN